MKPVDPTEDKGFSLRRWSQRKAAARAAPRTNAERDEIARTAAPAAGAATTAIARTEGAASVGATPVEQRTTGAPGSAGADLPGTVAHGAPASARPLPGEAPARRHPAPAAPLPAIDSLSIDSDFKAFMQPGVDESVKRSALRKLFSDPRFNVMDGLDVYIDDYSKPDPIDPAIVRTLAQARYIFNPPATRVTAEGYVEDVPEEELRAAARDPHSEAAAAPEAAPQDTAAVLPGVQPPTDAVLPIAQQHVDTVPSIAQPQVDAVPAIAQPQDDALPATKVKPDPA